MSTIDHCKYSRATSRKHLMSKLKNTTSSSSPFRERIDYLLTVCLYCWHLRVSNVGRRIDKVFNYIIRLVVANIVLQRYRYKIYRNLLNSQKAIAPMHWDLECGQHIIIAKNLVYQTCIGYLTFPFSVVVGIASSIIGWKMVLYWKDGTITFIIILLYAVFILVGLFKLSKAIDNPQTYLLYFKEFEKQDEEWHKKWKRNTILMFIGSIVSAAMSFGFGLLCIYIHKNLQGLFN